MIPSCLQILLELFCVGVQSGCIGIPVVFQVFSCVYGNIPDLSVILRSRPVDRYVSEHPVKFFTYPFL